MGIVKRVKHGLEATAIFVSSIIAVLFFAVVMLTLGKSVLSEYMVDTPCDRPEIKVSCYNGMNTTKG